MSLNVELLEQSFELVKPQADEFVASFYNNLFTDYPASKPLFEHSDMAGQQKMLKGALVMVVENLRKPDVLSKSLKGLGARHVKYGALPEHYPLVGNSLLKTLGQYAGGAWTPELKEAWTGAYGAISELMLEGADYSKEEVALESAPAPAEADGGLQVELLEQSFELVKPQADEFVASFYNNLLTDYPDAKPLFAHTSMPKQQQMLKGALVMVVENLRNPEVLKKSLGGLGARHVKYGALPEHYPLVGNSLLKTLGQYAGEAWTPALKSAWTDAYGAITELMLEGANYDKVDVQLGSVAASAAGGPVGATVSPNPSATTALPDLDGIAAMAETPEGLSNGAAAGVIGSCGAVLLAMLIILL
ncbi:MAG: globin family protein [Cyanobacteria bacterium J06621_11]